MEALGLIITMDLKPDGTGIMTSDGSAYGPGTPSNPTVTSMPIKWRLINDTCFELINNDPNTEPFLMNYNKADNRIWDTSGRTHLDLKKV